MKRIHKHYMLVVVSVLSFNCVLSAATDPWYQRAWNSIRPYFGWIAGGSAAGAAAGAGIAQRYKINPCVGAACGAVAGGLLAGGGSAFLASRVDRDAQEYAQNLSALLKAYTGKPVGQTTKDFLSEHDALINTLLNNKYGDKAEYNNNKWGYNSRLKIAILIRTLFALRDIIGQDIFNSSINDMQSMFAHYNSSANEWITNVDDIAKKVNNFMGDLVPPAYFEMEYSAEKMNAFIEKIGTLREN